jgi:hypothetical protein
MVFLDLREHWLRLLGNLRLLWFSLMYIISHHLWLGTLILGREMIFTRPFVAVFGLLMTSVSFVLFAGVLLDHFDC